MRHNELRKIIGCKFIAWADTFFADKNHLFFRMPFREVYQEMCRFNPELRHVSINEFKMNILRYCTLRGWLLNPQMYHPITLEPLIRDANGNPYIIDRIGGVEYMTVGPAEDRLITF